MSGPRINERLRRLIKSGICPPFEGWRPRNVSQYAKELELLAEKTADRKTAQNRSKLFKALADETRLRILRLLEVREMCVCEVMVALNLTQPTASHHLGLLENAGFAKKRKEGRWVFYSIVNPRLVKSMHKLDLL
jgi:DNA-binding transcriptional ArsR family regulator